MKNEIKLAFYNNTRNIKYIFSGKNLDSRKNDADIILKSIYGARKL